MRILYGLYLGGGERFFILIAAEVTGLEQNLLGNVCVGRFLVYYVLRAFFEYVGVPARRVNLKQTVDLAVVVCRLVFYLLDGEALRKNVGFQQVILRPHEAAGNDNKQQHEIHRGLGKVLAGVLFEPVARIFLRCGKRLGLRQLAGVQILGICIADSVRITEHDHASLVQPQHLVALRAHRLQRVRDHERGRVAVIDDALHLLLALFAEVAVADGEYLVKDDDVRLYHARYCECNAAFHAA